MTISKIESLLKIAEKFNLKKIKLGDFEAELDLESKVRIEQQKSIAKILSPTNEEQEQEDEDLLYHSGM